MSDPQTAGSALPAASPGTGKLKAIGQAARQESQKR